jgi:hypothetical protein
MKSNKSHMKNKERKITCAQAQDIHQLVSTRLMATHHGNNNKIPQ